MKSIGLSYALEGLDNLFLNFDALFYLRIGFVVNNVVTRVLSSLQKKRQIEIFHKNAVFLKVFSCVGVHEVTYSPLCHLQKNRANTSRHISTRKKS